MRGDDHRARQRADQRDEIVLDRPVHPAGGLIEADDGGCARLVIEVAQHDRERQALLLAAGEVPRMALGEQIGIEPDGSSASPAATPSCATVSWTR